MFSFLRPLTSFQTAFSKLVVLIAVFSGLPLFPVSGSLVINEFVASNGSVLADEDGDYEDWIEIYNMGEEALHLEGYGLSDDPEDPMRWRFPNVTILPGEFLLVWASGKNRSEPDRELHANFSISASGEPLLLSAADGALLDFVEAMPLGRDLALGRVPDGTGDWFYFDEPTPLAANTTTAYDDWLRPPQFSAEGGFYNSGFPLMLTTDQPGVRILYTTDGTEPVPARLGGISYNYKNRYPQTIDSNVFAMQQNSVETFEYESPISIANRSSQPNYLSRISVTGTSQVTPSYMPTSSVFKGTVVRARAVRDGALPSPIVTHSYFVHPNGSNRYSLPVISIAIPEDGMFGYENGIYTAGREYDQWWLNNPGQRSRQGWQRPGNFTQRGRDWEWPGHLEIFIPQSHGAVLAQNVGFRIHGGASRTRPQKSFRVYARRSYDEADFIEYPFFDDIFNIQGDQVQRFKRLILRNSGNDSQESRFRDGFIQAFLRPLGLDDQGFYPAVHFVNGEYWGLINVRERIDRYYIAERHLLDPDDIDVLTVREALLIEDDDDIDEYTQNAEDDFLALRNFIDQEDMADPENFAWVESQLDIGNYILYNMAQIYVGNTDWPHNNSDYWRKRNPDTRPGAPLSHDGRWRFIVYDTDFGFNRQAINSNTLEHATNPNPAPGWDGTDRRFSTVMLRNLLENENFRHRFINAFADHINVTFQSARASGLIDTFHAAIAPERNEHGQRWRDLGGNLVDDLKQFGQGRPSAMRNHLRTFFNLRGIAQVRFDVDNIQYGYLKINTIAINHATPGLSNAENPYPFTGIYFLDIPVSVTAKARPGYRFVGWEQYPEHTSATIEIIPQSGANLTALFEAAPEKTLLGYWNFNEIQDWLSPDYAQVFASLEVLPGPETVFTDGGGNGFIGINARRGDAAGRHLRINNPLGSEIILHVSTLGHEAPVLSYEARRSGQGAGRQIIEFSIDGVNFVEFYDITLENNDPVLYRFDFDRVEGAANNPDFHLRIRFGQGEGSVAGNNRIDNIAVEAVPMDWAVEIKYGFPVSNGQILSGFTDYPFHVELAPWVYQTESERWLFWPDPDRDYSEDEGVWLYFPRPEAIPQLR